MPISPVTKINKFLFHSKSNAVFDHLSTGSIDPIILVWEKKELSDHFASYEITLITDGFKFLLLKIMNKGGHFYKYYFENLYSVFDWNSRQYFESYKNSKSW